MSYNPAFVADELPLAHCASAADAGGQSNGIKLTSFKPLQSVQNQEQPFAANNQNESLQSYADATQKQTQSHEKRHASKKAMASTTNKHHHNHHNHQNQQQRDRHQNHQKSSSQNFLISTSSSLSLIDNPTLSSLATATTTTATNSACESSSYSCSSESSSNASSLMGQNPLGLCAAVECRDMHYAVGRGKNQKSILQNINVTVPEGSIYGLLGPSGCGKTTMLRCVVGRIKPRSGQVRVFGYRPNEAGSQIPGPAIGYMPQVSFLASSRHLSMEKTCSYLINPIQSL